jgi:hypothetical protein
MDLITRQTHKITPTLYTDSAAGGWAQCFRLLVMWLSPLGRREPALIFRLKPEATEAIEG